MTPGFFGRADRSTAVIVGGCLALASCFAVTDSAATQAARSRSLALYSVATAEQFRNDADDRQRGMGSNPFGRFSDTKAQDVSEGGGPYPGDQTVFEFQIYSDRLLHQSVGSAIIVCIYNFDKNAFCNATYTIKDGAIYADGGFNFNASSFTLAISGGTGKYADALGDIEVTPSAQHAQHLEFSFTAG